MSSLESQVAFLQNELEAYETSVNWNDDEFNYLAIGNSITKHPLADCWWNENSGMAASSEDKDYVHLVGKWLEGEKSEKVHFEAMNFYTWEVMSSDRSETLSLLDSYLSTSLDFVTIQLGENASDLATFKTDFVELIRYIEGKCPKAQIVVVGDFWWCDDRTDVKKEVASETGVYYASLEDIINDADYQCGLETIVYGSDGTEHVVEHDGVAGHPGDKGMEYIAEKIIEQVETRK